MTPFGPPIAPMLAKGASRIPEGSWWFEPKWDGFRALVFRDGDDLYLQSRDEKPLLRYFPELDAPLRAGLPPRCVLDGEIVIARGDHLDFDALLQRIHPAESRVRMLAEATPSSFVAFDLLGLDDDLRGAPFSERRARLEEILRDARTPLHLTPLTRDRDVASDWFHRFEGAGLDGVVGKDPTLPYRPGERVMVKVKHERTCDCVVAGFRWHKGGRDRLVGSLVLGLFDAQGRLHSVGVAASFTAKRREAMLEELAPWREAALDGHPWAEWVEWMEQESPERRPGMQSRWNQGRDLTWEPLRLGLVCEVGFNHLAGGRFRHPAHFKRWRPDKRPQDCTWDQLAETPAFELSRIFGA